VADAGGRFTKGELVNHSNHGKFYSSIEKAREDARPILTEKNAALVTTNPNGYSTTPGKWSKFNPATGII